MELPAGAGEICVGGEREARANPDLTEVLGASDEAEERLRRGILGEAC